METNEARQGFCMKANAGGITYLGIFREDVTQERIEDILTRPNFNYANVAAPLLDLRDLDRSSRIDNLADYAYFEQGKSCGVSWEIDLDTRTCIKTIINDGKGGVEDPDRNDSNYRREEMDLAKLSRAREGKAAYNIMAKAESLDNNNPEDDGPKY